MNIRIIASGIMRDPLFKNLYDEYKKRLNILKVSLIEFDDKNLSQSNINKKILESIDAKSYLIMLDERGKNLSTNQLLLEFKKGADLCNNKIDILIGGADGFLHDYFNEELGNKQILKISFGSITLPHMLARIILIEQIYRIETIIKNHPYHRS